ncbi:hypothetical protein CY34DRAFT_99514 [Suillus luteus UH-Slu-Lm8-n1]|uniref:Uncharacterized protein n=1 Tax=Suillus luteus UH-Slu-Lm8-n1 TaxID=930992 RepID=A0A0C9Z7J0_9AGAM|nr:hypothetical protein CY34DRAFT_99514 [Suillus luteus UH-Slu-Lm8-n1]
MFIINIVFFFPTTPQTNIANMNYTMVGYYCPVYGGVHWRPVQISGYSSNFSCSFPSHKFLKIICCIQMFERVLNLNRTFVNTFIRVRSSICPPCLNWTQGLVLGSTKNTLENQTEPDHGSTRHCFCIREASFYLAKKVDPEIVHLAGRWHSLAYETYIWALEQVASQHLSILSP